MARRLVGKCPTNACGMMALSRSTQIQRRICGLVYGVIAGNCDGRWRDGCGKVKREKVLLKPLDNHALRIRIGKHELTRQVNRLSLQRTIICAGGGLSEPEKDGLAARTGKKRATQKAYGALFLTHSVAVALTCWRSLGHQGCHSDIFSHGGFFGGELKNKTPPFRTGFVSDL